MLQPKPGVKPMPTLVVSADTRIQSVVARGYCLSTNRRGQLLARLNGVSYAVQSQCAMSPVAEGGQHV